MHTDKNEKNPGATRHGDQANQQHSHKQIHQCISLLFENFARRAVARQIDKQLVTDCIRFIPHIGIGILIGKRRGFPLILAV